MSAVAASHVASAGSAATPSAIPFFDALLLTASNPEQAKAFALEVRLRQQRGSLPSPAQTRVIVVCDPAGQRIGSGGATLAALEALLQQMPGATREDKVQEVMKLKVGMFHSGGDSQRLPTSSVRGKAFCGFGADESCTASGVFESTPLDFLIARLAKLQRCPGVLISATDTLLDFPEDYPPILAGSPESQGVLGCTVRVPRRLGSAHGVFVVDPKVQAAAGGRAACAIMPVADILQKASQSELEAAGAVEADSQTVLLDAGNIFLCPQAVAALLRLAVQAPFHSCCQVPLAAAANPDAPSDAVNVPPAKAFRFELYTDILLPMNPRMSLESYLASAPPDPSCPAEILSGARRLLWNALKPFPCFAAVHPHASFFHIGTMPERMHFMHAPHGADATVDALRKDTGFALQAHAAYDHPAVAQRSQGAAVLNAMLQSRPEDDGFGVELPSAAEDAAASPSAQLSAGSFIEYSHLRGHFHLAEGAMVSGVRSRELATDLRVPAHVVVQETQMHHGWAQVLEVRHPHLVLAGAAVAGSADLLQPPPTVISIFHCRDSIKTPYNAAGGKVTFLGISFVAFLTAIQQVLQGGQKRAAADVPAAAASAVHLEGLREQIWPHARADSDRTLWSARLFPVFQSADTLQPEGGAAGACSNAVFPFHSAPELHVWMLRLSGSKSNRDDVASALPSPEVLSSWLAAPRASFADILAAADGSAENLWRERLACLVDRRLLQQHLLTARAGGAAAATPPQPRQNLLPSLLARSVASHLHYPSFCLLDPLERALDGCATRCAGRRSTLDISMRACWILARMLALQYPAETAEIEDGKLTIALKQHPALEALRMQLARADSDSFVHVLPWALATLSATRRSWWAMYPDAAERTPLASILRGLYGAASAALSRVAVASRPDLSFAPRAAEQRAVKLGETVALEGALRIDLYGGWTDTPPVCFENASGGSVVNVAIRVGGQLPLQLRGKVELQPNPVDPCIVVHFIDPSSTEPAERVLAPASLRCLADFADYAEPHAPAALLKCVLIAMGIVRLPGVGEEHATSAVPELREQIAAAYWQQKERPAAAAAAGGADSQAVPPVCLHVRSWVALGAVSQGTGLGVSSLLGAYLVQLVARVFDRVYSPQAVVSLVLLAEQLLSTGGGWQDQVGGLWAGVKHASCPGRLPLRVEVQRVPVPSATLQAFSARLLLVHTGMPRLARNLLRTVLDHWATREPTLAARFEQLAVKAPLMSAALQAGRWPEVGQLLSEYWGIKRQLATPLAPANGGAVQAPAEPPHVTAFLQRVQLLVHGASLVGAGGGGFLVLLAEPEQHAAIAAQVESFNEQRIGMRKETDAMPYRLFAAEVCDEEGSQMRITLEDAAAF